MWLVVLISIFSSFYAQASIQVQARIHHIDRGQDHEETLVFLTTGHVIRFKNEIKNQQLLKQISYSRQWYRFALSDNHELESFQVITSPRINSLLSNTTQEETYAPTVIENMELATEYFREAKYVNKESQCYNRAHIWSYEWFLKNAINSNKTWIFFTRRYIRKFKFDWWFHVSPSVIVSVDGIKKEKIMDVKYGRGPLDLKKWTDIFMRNDAHCPRVQTYSEYANYPESGSCYIMKTSMFYYQPVDMENHETWGTSKSNWYDIEVQQAYLEAFDEVI